MAGRPKNYEEEVLIQRATEVFWKKGFTATSAKDLMKAMDVGQGSFYRTFGGGKQELYEKSLKKFLEEPIQTFYKKLDETEEPIRFIKDFFFRLISNASKQRQYGCYLGNGIVEQSNLNESTRAIASKELDKLKEGFEKALIKAKEKGLLSKEKEPKLLALYLINLWSGINITQRMDLSENEIKNVLELNLKILD